MPWKKHPGYVLSEGSVEWTHHHVSNGCPSPEEARRIALRDPKIKFFVFCRHAMELNNEAWHVSPKTFLPNDVIFFTGETGDSGGNNNNIQMRRTHSNPCDLYVKTGMSIAYVDTNNVAECRSALEMACGYTTSDGGAAVDVIILFAANLNYEVPEGFTALAPYSYSPGSAIACANRGTLEALESGMIKNLQAKGITVLLTFLPNHDGAGWSQFSNEDGASEFVQQLKIVVETYGLDGIDIDDEYADAPSLPNSLAMVARMMREELQDKIISKALFQDLDVLTPNLLTYGWEMSYSGRPQDRLEPYVDARILPKHSLSNGFQAGFGGSSITISEDVYWLNSNGYGGFMVFNFGIKPNQDLLGELVNAWLGPGNWILQEYKP